MIRRAERSSEPPCAGRERWLDALAPAIEDRVRAAVEREGLPGVSVGIVRPAGLALRVHAGFAQPAARRAPDDDTLYRVASVTKTLTATALVWLRDQGRLRLDDPVLVHLPEFVRVRALRGRCEDVTLAHLLSHRAGLESEGPFVHWDSARFASREALLRSLPEAALVLEPGRAVKYSNLAFALLGEVVARVAGESYESFVTRTLLVPLGMDSSVFVLDEAARTRLATGHRPAPDAAPFAPGEIAETGGFAAAFGLSTSLADLARWIRLQLGAASPLHGEAARPLAAEKCETSFVLSPRSLEEMHRPLVIDPDWRDARCLGWQAMREGEHVFVGHGGSIHGFVCWALFHRATRCGVIVLTNRGRHDRALALAFELAARVVGAACAVQPEAVPVAGAEMPADAHVFAGLYRMRFGGCVRLAWRDGAVHVEAVPGEPFPLHGGPLVPTGEPRVLLATSGRAAGEQVRFEPARGAAERFVVGGFTYDRTGD